MSFASLEHLLHLSNNRWIVNWLINHLIYRVHLSSPLPLQSIFLAKHQLDKLHLQIDL
jgi:hypothetical protein